MSEDKARYIQKIIPKKTTWEIIARFSSDSDDLSIVILAKGAKTNLPDNQLRTTPLFWAEHKGYAGNAELLRQPGATE